MDLSDTNSLSEYKGQFSALRRDVSKTRWTLATCGGAPHKPLLLLAILDAAEAGDLSVAFVELTERIMASYRYYWLTVMPKHRRGDIFKPFFHMRTSPFWVLVPQPDMEAALGIQETVTAMSVLRGLILGARIDEQLLAHMQNANSRAELRAVLLQSYFSAALQGRLRQAILENHESDRYAEQLTRLAVACEEPSPPFTTTAPAPVRSHGFRKAVVAAYENRCAICSIRILTGDGHSAVEAAHIVPWAESYNDNIQNGLALCKLCHWAFDELMVSIDRKQAVLVSPSVSFTRNFPGHIAAFQGRPILQPANSAMAPAEEFLAHHRKRYREAG